MVPSPESKAQLDYALARLLPASLHRRIEPMTLSNKKETPAYNSRVPQRNTLAATLQPGKSDSTFAADPATGFFEEVYKSGSLSPS